MGRIHCITFPMKRVLFLAQTSGSQEWQEWRGSCLTSDAVMLTSINENKLFGVESHCLELIIGLLFYFRSLLFGMKVNYWKLKSMKRNVLGVSLPGMSPSIDKNNPCLFSWEVYTMSVAIDLVLGYYFFKQGFINPGLTSIKTC